MEISSRLAAVALVAGAFVLPANALAASVRVEEVSGHVNHAALYFEAAPAEGNRLDVSVRSEAGGYFRVRLVDTGAAITPGAGCSGGGSVGAAVDCLLHRPEPGVVESCNHLGGCTPVSGTPWETSLRIVLGDSGSVLEAGSFPAARKPDGSREVSIEVLPGAGNDTVTTSSGRDVIRASGGDDVISTGLGEDVYFGGAATDGADRVDLGEVDEYEADQVDYRERQSGVTLSTNGIEDDGAPGEGDDLAGVDIFYGGAGDDFLESGTTRGFRSGERLLGGAGDDSVLGGVGDDSLLGNSGDDTLRGRGGEDTIWGHAGADVAEGGAGEDEIDTYGGDDTVRGGPNGDQVVLGPGDDRALGGPGSDLLLGEAGDDRLLGGEGFDGLVGAAGADQMLGGPDTDLILAGVVPEKVWGDFLFSPGPLENAADRVDCGPGGDAVRIDRRDRPVRCERSSRSSNLEVLREISQADEYLSAQLWYVNRVPGTISLRGRGLKPQGLHDEADYATYPHSLELQPVGRAKRRWTRTGRLKLHAVVTLRPDAGGPPLRRTVPVRLVHPKIAAST